MLDRSKLRRENALRCDARYAAETAAITNYDGAAPAAELHKFGRIVGSDMSKQTWICAACRKAYLRKKSLSAVECPKCRGRCEPVRYHFRVPSPKQTKTWDDFVAKNRADNARIRANEQAERERQATIESDRPSKRSPPKPRVAYLEAISTPLIRTLGHSAALPADQLAGHAANLDFWINEARHCLAVIDGYQERFRRLRAGQAEYERQHEIGNTGAPLQRGTKDQWRKELRQGVCEAIERFLLRCHREGFLSEEALGASLAALGQ